MSKILFKKNYYYKLYKKFLKENNDLNLNMGIFDNVIIEDLETYKKGLNNKNFQFCNVISNRITMNAVFIESKESALIGAIIKDILPEFQRLEEEYENKVRNEFIKVINIYIDNIEKLDYILIMDKYSEYYDIYKQYFNTNFEKYTENKDYSSRVIKFCLEFLKKELDDDILPFSEQLLTSGVLNEISRVTRNFGCTTHQHMLKLILSFFSRLRDYYKVLVLSDEKETDNWKNRYEKCKEKLNDNIQDYELSDTYIERCLEDLYDFIKEWRFMFMRLMNLIPPMQLQQIKIPSRIESELKEMVSETISKKLEGEEK